MKIVTAKEQEEVGKRLAAIMREVCRAGGDMPVGKWCDLEVKITADVVSIANIVGGMELINAVGKEAYKGADTGAN